MFPLSNEELPQIKDIQICETVEEAVRDSDIISFTTTVRDDVSSFPYINGDWVKKGALISMPSAARFDDDFLVNKCKLVVDNSKTVRSLGGRISVSDLPADADYRYKIYRLKT